MANFSLLAFFRDGTARKIKVKELTAGDRVFSPYLTREEHFNAVRLQPDGYGVCWSENAVLSDQTLYRSGELIPLTMEDFYRFVSLRIVNSAEAQELLHWSRQNLADLVKRDRLHPLRTDGNNRLFRLA